MAKTRALVKRRAAVQNIRLTSAQMVAWDAVASAVRYNVYRDLASTISYGSPRTCRNDLDPDLTDTSFFDPAVPPPGEAFAYSVAAVSGTGDEGSLGTGTCAERSNPSPCP